jgi:hypothetical protein
MEGSGSGLNRATILEFAWVERGEPRKFLFKVIGFPTEIQKDYLSDTIKKVRKKERSVKSYIKHLLQEIRQQLFNLFYSMHNSIT